MNSDAVRRVEEKIIALNKTGVVFLEYHDTHKIFKSMILSSALNKTRIMTMTKIYKLAKGVERENFY